MLTHPLIERVERTGYPYPSGKKAQRLRREFLDSYHEQENKRYSLPAIPYQKGR